tara:strand:+ start:305 stop:583 length:279 start_codon:yes stop_codon:yes gene_type:complete
MKTYYAQNFTGTLVQKHIITLKRLNDGTRGVRFNVLPSTLAIKGLTRKRGNKSRGYKVTLGKCTNAVHFGKRSVYVEHKPNRASERKMHKFA